MAFWKRRKDEEDKPLEYYVDQLLKVNKVNGIICVVLILLGVGVITYETISFQRRKGCITGRFVKPLIDKIDSDVLRVKEIACNTPLEKKLKKTVIRLYEIEGELAFARYYVFMCAIIAGFFIIPYGLLLMYLWPYWIIAQKLKQKINQGDK